MEFRLLGPLEAIRDGRSLELGGAQQRALLAVLLLHRGEVVSTDRLIDELWGESSPPTASKTVQVYVSRLRKALGEGTLISRRPGYLLALEPDQLDIDRFESLVAEGRHALERGDSRKAVAQLRRALELWRGPPLADFPYWSFAQSETARLDEARLAAIEDLTEAELSLGHHARVVAELEALVHEHPLRERFQRQLMLALYRSGRGADALERYRRARQALIDELGLEPGGQLQELERAILTQDRSLERSTRTPEAAIARRVQRGGTLIAAGGVALLAVLTLVAVRLIGSSASVVRVTPNSLAAIDVVSNRVVAAVPVGARPDALVFGSGSLWVANLDDQTVSRVDPATLQPLRTLSLSDPPTGIAAAQGRVWVVVSNPSATVVKVSRIDPQYDTIARPVAIGNVVPGSPAAVAAQDAALWVAPYSGELTRLAPYSGRVEAQFDPNSAPAGLAVGAGAVWLTDNDAGNVVRVDPTGLVTSIPVGHGPSGIAVGYGGVWAADAGDDAVVRIDPSTRAVTATIPVGHSPAGVAVGAGSVWVTNSGDGTVTRIDPTTMKATTTIPVGGSPQAITIADSRAWVTVDAPSIPPANARTGGPTLRIVSSLDVSSMDPALADDGLSFQLLYATCAKLLNYPDKSAPAGSQIVPEVAQSLPERTRDGRNYTFTIRPGFRFSPPSGQPVTAQTFRYAIERTLNPRMHSPFAHEFADIVGGPAYMAGRSPHIAGVAAQGPKLTIRLIAPAPDLLARVAGPALCAVPSDTPINPQGVRLIPSAGPYRVSSYAPGQGIVLTPNPNYHGTRPHHLARIEVAVGITNQRAIAQVEAGTANYAASGVPAADAAMLRARYGPGSPAATDGHQEYFVNLLPQLDMLALNTHRPLFADARLRKAVNYAIDRTALARLGDEYAPLPEHPTDHYLPPGIPGYRDTRIYPLTPDVAKAKALAKGRTPATTVLYTCDVAPCDQQAQIVKTDLAAIGIQVQVKAYPDRILYTKLATPGEPFDIAWVGWVADYPDPDAILNVLLEGGTVIPTFIDAAWRARLTAAARLSGPRRYLTYARLDAELTRNAAPLVAFGNLSNVDFFSARVGCQAYGNYGMDLAALCMKDPSR